MKQCACGKPAVPPFDTCDDPHCEIAAWRKWFAENCVQDLDEARPRPSQDVPTQPETAGPLTALRLEAYEVAAKCCDENAALARQKLLAAQSAGDAGAVAVWNASLIACRADAKRIRALIPPAETERKTAIEATVEVLRAKANGLRAVIDRHHDSIACSCDDGDPCALARALTPFQP